MQRSGSALLVKFEKGGGGGVHFNADASRGSGSLVPLVATVGTAAWCCMRRRRNQQLRSRWTGFYVFEGLYRNRWIPSRCPSRELRVCAGVGFLSLLLLQISVTS